MRKPRLRKGESLRNKRLNFLLLQQVEQSDQVLPEQCRP